MKVLEEKKQFMREYWLNSLTDTQVDALETEWFSSDEDAELLEIVRGDLIEDYLTNNLNTTELNYFKNHFLLNNAEEISIAKSYLDLSHDALQENPKPNFFEIISAYFQNLTRVLQVGFAVILLGTFVLFFRFYNSEPLDIAQIDAPVFDQTNTVQNLPNPVSEQPANSDVDNKDNKNAEIKNNNPKAVEKNLEKPVEKPVKPQILFLTNFRGTVKTLKLSRETKTFSLKLDMPGIDKVYKNYEVRIYDSENSLIVREKLNNLSSIKSGEKVEIRNLDKNKFKRNKTYKTSLVGYDESENIEELSVYDNFKID